VLRGGLLALRVRRVTEDGVHATLLVSPMTPAPRAPRKATVTVVLTEQQRDAISDYYSECVRGGVGPCPSVAAQWAMLCLRRAHVAAKAERFGEECNCGAYGDWHSRGTICKPAPAPPSPCPEPGNCAAGGKCGEDAPPTFEKELASLLNSYSQENMSNTPDFILAAYLVACLKTFNETSLARERWYGKSLHI